MQRFSTMGFATLLVAQAIEAAPPNAQWTEKMRKLSQTLSDIVPHLVTEKPATPRTIKKLTEGAKTIAQLAHEVKMGSETSPDADPSIPFLSELFEREAKTALHAFQTGSAEYGKASLRTVTSYCISCHTRTDQGPNFPTLPLNTQMGNLNRMERAQLLAATRQFDKALTEFEAVISDKTIAKTRQIEWGRAVRHAFTIAVRVQRDPDKALKILARIEALPSVPVLFKDFTASWKKSLLEWKKEGKNRLESEEALFKEAQRLSKEAESLQKYPLDHAADITYLRLSLVAHELLSRYPKGKNTSDVLLLLGNAYDLLDDHLISPLPEMYYEACIRRAPHTPTSERCYQRYEANVYFGYTGSAGTSIPADIEKVMNELKVLAKKK